MFVEVKTFARDLIEAPENWERISGVVGRVLKFAPQR